MAFWNRSDDPWDRDPVRERKKRERESRRRERWPESGSVGSPLDALQAWNGKRKAEAAEREAAWAAEPAEKCPWCGKDMERGYLCGGRGILTWTPGRMTVRSTWIGAPREIRERQLRVDNEGSLVPYKTAWYCPACEKMTVDAAGLKSPRESGFWADESPLPEERAGEQEGKREDQEGEETP